MRKEAAFVVIPYGNLVMAVARDYNPFNLGFPGGKIEIGERPEVGALRELYEETGMSCNIIDHIKTIKNNRGWKVHFYLGDGHHGEFRPSSEGYPLWSDPDDLVAPTCLYYNHNREILRLINLI